MKSKDFLWRKNVQFNNWTALNNSGTHFHPLSLGFLFYAPIPPITLDSNFPFKHHRNQTLFFLETRNVNYSFLFSFSQGCYRTWQYTVWLWWTQSHIYFSHLASESIGRLWELSHLMSLSGYQRLSDVQKVKMLNICFPCPLCVLGPDLRSGVLLAETATKNIAWRISTQMQGPGNIPSLNCPFFILVLRYDLGYNS